MRVAGKLNLMPAVGRARPRPADRHSTAAERDLAGFVAVPNRRPVRDLAALRADDLVDLGLHQLVQHAKPGADAQRQPPSYAAPASMPSASTTDAGSPAMP